LSKMFICNARINYKLKNFFLFHFIGLYATIGLFL
jgi:hypothetical protein